MNIRSDVKLTGFFRNVFIAKIAQNHCGNSPKVSLILICSDRRFDDRHLDFSDCAGRPVASSTVAPENRPYARSGADAYRVAHLNKASASI